MEGIRILYVDTVRDASLIASFYGWAIGLVITALVTLFAAKNWKRPLALLAVSICFFLIGKAIDNNTIAHKEIHALINEDVSFVELDSKYEILRKQGDIYIMEERTNEAK